MANGDAKSADIDIKDALARALVTHGLILRGGFRPKPEDALPTLPDGGEARSLLLIGHAGGALWPAFALFAGSDKPDPLDSWSRHILDSLAAHWKGLALYPFGGPPYWPFQRWAERADDVYPSPLKILIHAEYGLWHAYRGALLLGENLDFPPRAKTAGPCAGCDEKPCLSACPVGAVRADDLNVEACLTHIASPAGEPCRTGGCRARLACPVGRNYIYDPAQQAFHMQAFLRAGLKRRGRQGMRG